MKFLILNRFQRQKAFTLVEAIIAFMLFVTLVWILYSIQAAVTRSQSRSDNTSEAVQAFYILQQNLVYDMRMLVNDGAHPIKINSTSGKTNNGVEFHVFSRDESEDDILRTELVQYEFFPDEFSVKRNGKVLAQAGAYEELEFYFEPPDGGGAGVAVENNLLFRVTTIGTLTKKQIKSGAATDRNEFLRATFMGGIGIPYKTGVEEYSTWVMNHSSKPQ